MADFKNREQQDSQDKEESCWYSTKKLSPATLKALEAMEPQRTTGAKPYREPPELKARVDRLIERAKDLQAPPQYKLGPVDPIES